MTLEEAQAKLTERNPGVDALTFEATRKPAFIKCSKCGYEAEVSRFELAYKWKCPTCAAKDTIRQRIETFRNFLDRNGKEHIEITEYSGDRKPAVLTCTKCGRVHQLAAGSSIKSFSGCKSCDKKKRMKWSLESLNKELDAAGSPLTVQVLHNAKNGHVTVHCQDCSKTFDIGNFRSRLIESNYACPECEQENKDLTSIKNKLRYAVEEQTRLSVERIDVYVDGLTT